MKILQINAVGQTSSTGRSCKEMQDFINSTTEHLCFTAFADGEPNEFSFQIGSRFDHKLHAFLSRLFGKQAHFSRYATKRALKKIDIIKPDIIILRNLHSNYINLPLLSKYILDQQIPTVIVLHDCWFFTGKCTHYTLENCYKWKVRCENCPKLKFDNKSWFFDFTKDLWLEKKSFFQSIPKLAVVGVSDWITNEARQSFLSKATEILRIYNWIDLKVFYPRECEISIKNKYGISDKKLILGVSSFWNEDKGLSKFIELSKMLDKKYQIILVGQLPEKIILPNNISNIQQTSSSDVLAELYSTADVFVTTSLQETFGKVSAEALACGTPVVCFDSTANRELVGINCGFAVEPNNIKEMKDAIVEICSKNKKEYKDFCRKYAENHFDKSKAINEYLNLFMRLIK